MIDEYSDTSISRRQFLQTTAAASAGLVLGFHLPTKPAHAAAAGGDSELFSPNAFIRITATTS